MRLRLRLGLLPILPILMVLDVLLYASLRYA